ncbi:Aldo/keto reductase [Gloeophyllum trabeum ATCC 11539]|uniref:Aldo/keto reductase n=1 Tax=Gloeophyllum trabeum (strain ATCC 11539 / FP-39264 / Madison 617) TaxID=670483 RepID=S7RHJ5_GLOTA|nr:Aldo/keto reductase [Gloeophyllum trabeum ATCC 11539]EPQ53765.1 Aldo/keto reductase [Gloeophyllum trabeum ATCC 11539]
MSLLPTRKIGQDVVTAIGYGAMGIAAFYGKPLPDEELSVGLKLCHQFLDTLFESGCTNWDTANVYHDSEELLGKWFEKTGRRKDIFLATKFGVARQPGRVINGDPEYVRECIEKSLKRLRTNYVDLYYLHRADPKVPIEITVGAMAELVKEGKVRYLGLSEISSATLRRAHAVHPIAAIEVEYSPFTLDIEDEKIGLLKTARELGVKIIAYSPLGRGLLTGRYKSPDDFDEGDFRRRVPRYSKENFPNILKLVDGLKAIGERHGATAGQVALAWLLAQGDDVIPIPGTTKVENLKENLGAVSVKLTQQEVEEIRALAEKSNSAQGARYPPDLVETLFSDTPPLEK